MGYGKVSVQSNSMNKEYVCSYNKSSSQVWPWNVLFLESASDNFFSNIFFFLKRRYLDTHKEFLFNPESQFYSALKSLWSLSINISE